ncbi:altered inheritance of mitochondria protein 3-like isoform X2 [Belonocnema kinseyi]|uniref:altered inheritance of mitochondria protein 3-like isoform X2 n=1 Tax=Belonocnema kinseyi TaxID=2817044 RepID=UPI00143D2A21|nr:altered inheritance of mitochondria protein 3-like isoform X2 [Belonocnema kinseyi]
MKLLLLSVCLVGTTFAVPINTRQRRDILPGDSRFGTDYHRQLHRHHDNEVEVTKAIGTYAGTYTEQLPHQQYGPPFYQPSQPLKDYTPVVEDVKKTVEQAAPVQVVQEEQPTQNVQQTVEIPTGSYGAPPVQQPEVIQNVQTEKQTAPLNSYGTPVQNYEQVQTVQHVESVQEVQQAEPVQQIEQVQPAQTLQYIEPVQTLQHVEPLPTFENIQPQPTVQQVQPQPFQIYGPPSAQSPVRVQQTLVQPIQQVQPVKQVQPVQEAQPVNQVQYVQQVQQVQPVRQVQQVQPVRQVQQVQPVRQVQQVQPVRQVQQVQPVRQVQQVQPVRQIQQVPQVQQVQKVPQIQQVSQIQQVPQVQQVQPFNAYGPPLTQQSVKVQETPQVAPVVPVVHATHVVKQPARQSFSPVSLSYQPALSGYNYPNAPLQVHQLPAPVRQVQYQTPVQVHHVPQVQYQTPVQHVAQVQYQAPVQVQHFKPVEQYKPVQEVKNYQVPQVQRGYLSPPVQQSTLVQQPAIQENVSFDTPVQSIEVPLSSQAVEHDFLQIPEIPNSSSFGDSIQVVDVGKKVSQPAEVPSQSYADNGGYVY